VKADIVYDAWGHITNTPNATYRGWYAWTGRMFDVETDLQYNRARWYDPNTGRWLTQDPMGFDAGDSNLYRYACNGPVGADDPTGTYTYAVNEESAIELGMALGALGIRTGYRPVGLSGRYVMTTDATTAAIDRASRNLGLDPDLRQALRALKSPTENYGWGHLIISITAPGLRQPLFEYRTRNFGGPISLTPEEVFDAGMLMNPNLRRDARLVMEHAQEILNNDDLYQKAVRYYDGIFVDRFMTTLLRNRTFYRDLVNKVMAGLDEGFPELRPANEGTRSEGAGVAYALRLGGSIYLRRRFWTKKPTGVDGQAYFLVHEFGRVYLWNELGNDSAGDQLALHDINTWDAFIQSLDRNYDRIKAQK
jgi:RHS repeat-associated protein